MESTAEPVRNVAGANVKRVNVRKRKNQIPDSILNNTDLNGAIDRLPKNYNFEIHKTVHRIQTENASLVGLQFPEGLLMYACLISDIIERFTTAKTVVLGDVTYGACCVDDLTAQKLGADLLVHYGHSCLVPINVTTIKVLYVFVEISFNINHLIDAVSHAFPVDTRLALMGTIQFSSAIYSAAEALKNKGFESLTIPQSKPLSGGETLGCTSAVLSNVDVLVFVADGRFHLEAAMIQNPTVAAYRYDPYCKVLTREGYDTEKMKEFRWHAIQAASRAKTFGVILGTLGRQGSPKIFARIRQLLGKSRRVYLFLMAELNPAKMATINGIDVSCPRLSIDWGSGFHKPVLTPYELEVMVGSSEWSDVYPMDYYRLEGGNWTNYSKT